MGAQFGAKRDGHYYIKVARVTGEILLTFKNDQYNVSDNDRHRYYS